MRETMGVIYFPFYFIWLPYEKIISLKETGKLIWYKYLNTSFTQLNCPYCIKEHVTIWSFWHDLSLVFMNSGMDAKVSEFW